MNVRFCGQTDYRDVHPLNIGLSSTLFYERAEVHDAATLKTLKEAVKALNCTLIYAFVPKKPLDLILEDRARRKVHDQIGMVALGMLPKKSVDDQRADARSARIYYRGHSGRTDQRVMVD